MDKHPFDSMEFSELSAEAVDRIEQRVRHYAAVLGPPPRNMIRLPHTLRIAVAACLTLLVMSVAVLQVSANSLPDDTLYPLKRAMEDVRLEYSSDKPTYESELAQTRIDEFEHMLEQGKIYPQLLEDSNRHMQHILDETDDHLTLERVARLGLYQAELIKQLVVQSNHKQQEDLLRIGQKTADIQSQVGQEVTPPTPPSATVVIEGPVEAIGPDFVVIYGIKIQLDPAGINLGDTLVVEGSIDLRSNTFIVTSTDEP
ncbi:MAG: DUF5667 domain-containing protein [Chloroflexi bacterium]|nr:DUF5667 domain-containing protein [Chloroflexota bacterium]